MMQIFHTHVAGKGVKFFDPGCIIAPAAQMIEKRGEPCISSEPCSAEGFDSDFAKIERLSARRRQKQ